MTASLLLLLFSLAGIVDSAYLTIVHLTQTGACGAEAGCSEVLGSSYATLLGIPLSAFGLGAYCAFAALAWRSLDSRVHSETIRWISILSFPAFLFSMYLVGVQAFVLGEWCQFCLLSALLATSIFATAVITRVRSQSLSPLIGSLASRHLVPPVSLLVGIPLFVSALPKSEASEHAAPDSVIARIGEREITADEVDRAIKLKLYQARNGLRRDWLDRQLLETAAAEKNMDVRAYVQEEVYRKIEVTQEEIDQRYEEVKDRLPPHITKEAVSRNIRNEIGNRKSKTALDTFIRALEKQYGTSYAPPAAERFVLDPNPRGGPEKGPTDAPVTIVEFSDLQCHYCSRAHQHLKDLHAHYGGRIRVVFKHLPLDMHEHARYAAEVAACTHQQGFFWPLADSLFANQDTMNPEGILNSAVNAGADRDALQSCIDSGIGAKVVDADIGEADDLGLSSTPSFFVNGDYVGSLPKDGLSPLIERELSARQ